MLQTSFEDRFAAALLTVGLLTEDQLLKARQLTQSMNGQKGLNDVLLEMNWISSARLDEFMKRQRGKLRTGEILVARRMVTHQQVTTALEEQRKNGSKPKRIGEILVEMGIIEERHVLEALAEKFSLPLIDPDISRIDQELARRT